MTIAFNASLDLTITRIIEAPRAAVWKAWTDAASFEQWWIPEPAKCKVVEMDLRPGGALTTHMSENGGEFLPHIQGCYLAIEEMERIAFTNSLVGGWRPAAQPLMTAIVAFRVHPKGTELMAHVMHKDNADRDMHEKMGFYDGWGAVLDQLAGLAGRKS